MPSEADKEISRCGLVTGANRGLGYGCVRKLAKKFKGTVYLTARNEEAGLEALHALHREDLLAEFLVLDVTKQEDIERARDTILEKHGGLDLLINNAGIGGSEDTTDSDVETARSIIETNFYSVLHVSEILCPILRSHARVVNMSSEMGHLKFLRNEDLEHRLKDHDLTIDQLKEIIEEYMRIVEDPAQDPGELGYPTKMRPYSVSKLGVTVLSRLQQKLLDEDKTREDIVVNACSPGHVATDMTHYQGSKTIDEGVEIPLFCALLPHVTDENSPDIPRGQFVRDTAEIDWAAERTT